MAYRGALVDRAVIRRKQRQATKVDGRTIFTSQDGPEFRARLQLPQANEDTRDERTAAVIRPTLMTDRKDSDGDLLDFRTSDRILVTSRQLGTALWEVTGEPEPLRKKRRVIGWVVPINRVDEPVVS